MKDPNETGQEQAKPNDVAEHAPSCDQAMEVGRAPAGTSVQGGPGRDLQRQWEELRTILDSVPAYIWLKDRENRILRANRLAAESIGMSPSELEGRSTYDLYPADAKKYHVDDLEVIRTGRPKIGIVEPLRIRDRTLWLSTDKVPYRDVSGNIVGVIVFAVDITARVLAEEALRRAHDELERRVEERTADLAQAADNLRAEMMERSKVEAQIRRKDAELAHLQRVGTVESIATELAHQMNQPLAAIVNFARGLTLRLQDGTHDAEALLRAADQISKQAVRAARILQRLRDFIATSPPRRVSCDVGRIITDAVSLIEIDAHAQNINVRTVVEPGLGDVEVDPVQIEQVMLNLVRNGLEAMADISPNDDAELLVQARRHGSRVEVSVIDGGSGLPGTDTDDIFLPFFTTKEGGLGMGLAICRSIVTAHNGDLRAAPNRGRGATFSFTLPCK